MRPTRTLDRHAPCSRPPCTTGGPPTPARPWGAPWMGRPWTWRPEGKFWKKKRLFKKVLNEIDFNLTSMQLRNFLLSPTTMAWLRQGSSFCKYPKKSSFFWHFLKTRTDFVQRPAASTRFFENIKTLVKRNIQEATHIPPQRKWVGRKIAENKLILKERDPTPKRNLERRQRIPPRREIRAGKRDCWLNQS